ncbi:MAG TPA: TIGR03560 family F420-dependent LLM class oxidoreductase [Candidatus Limnocylindria bacterium]|nr:TIGR03560 family F420-dependent LLM class oxidoreductase [Candidatus Limnocylindria bacterium]
MRFALMTEPQQGLSYEEILAAARAAEQAGLEAFFRSDHYSSFPGAADNPTTDAWATLAGLARDTFTIHLGTLVSPVTFRHPGNLAKVAATVDEMSHGRLEVGIGAGWNDVEHAAYGFRYPDLPERYDMLEETLTIVHGLWTEPDGWSFGGEHWQVSGALFRPRPTASGKKHPHVILGGDGGPRQARLVATWADEFNRSSATPDRLRVAYGRVRDACETLGRDPEEVTRSAMVGVLVAETPGELQERAQAMLVEFGSGAATDGEAWLAERRGRWIMGTPDEANDQIRRFEAAGAQRIMFQDFLPRDLEMIGLLGRIARG